MDKKPEPIKYLAYLRKSSEQDERQMLSIPAQRIELEDLVRRERLHVVDWIEESHSAMHPYKRIKFEELKKRIKKGGANAILTWNPNRLSRNAVDTGELIYLLDLKNLVEIRTPQQIFKDTPTDKFLFGLFCNQAKLENDNKGVDVKKGLKTKASLGWLPSGAPIGYMNTPEKLKGFKTIEVDPKRFNLVRRMWDLLLTGNYTVPSIWKMSKEWDLTTIKRRRIGGKHLSRSAVYALFTNPFYYGFFEFPRGSGTWLKGEHEPMITQEEFDRTQLILGKKGKKRAKEHDFTFSGVMRCFNCDSGVTVEEKIKRQKNGNIHYYVYHHCTKRKNENCEEKSIELKELNKQIEEYLENITISERLRKWAIKYLHEVRTNEAETHETILKNKHAELEVVVNQLDGLMLKYTSPDNADGRLISNDEFQNIKSSLLKRKNFIETVLASHGKQIEQWVELAEKTFNLACYARIWFKKGDDATKRAIVSSLGSNLLLKDRKLHINMHPFFQSISAHRIKAENEIVSVRTSENSSIERQKGASAPLRPIKLPG